MLIGFRGDEELGELTLRDAAAVELLQALGKVVRLLSVQHVLPVKASAFAGASMVVTSMYRCWYSLYSPHVLLDQHSRQAYHKVGSTSGCSNQLACPKSWVCDLCRHMSST
jgi:hypothetical protein